LAVAGTDVQELVDALSVALARPVLLDDEGMAPLAFSRQWGDIDPVRTASILARGAAPPVREALLADGVADAVGVVRTVPRPDLGMAERVCVPVWSDGQLVGYLWLLDQARTLTPAELLRAEETAGLLGRALRPPQRSAIADCGPLLAGLWTADATERQRAAEALAMRGLVPDGRLVICWVAPVDPGADAAAVAGAAVQRLSAGHGIAGGEADRAALVVRCGDPVLTATGTGGIAAWVHRRAGDPVAVGQSDVAVGPAQLADAARQARLALRVARARDSGQEHAAWGALGSDRLVAQLPDESAGDVPVELARLIRERPDLAATLEAFLATGASPGAAARALSLHRSGLYYRLRRIEELTGLDLERGDDRLLAHLALRAVALAL
jgi:hypothetical protein